MDDEFFFRRALERSQVSAELTYAEDGAAAIRLLEEVRGKDGGRRPGCPDVIFLDLKMPVVSGFDVLVWLGEHPFDPPLDVAVLSGSDRASDIARAKALGASGFYIKPFSPGCLKDHLQGSRAQRKSSPS